MLVSLLRRVSINTKHYPENSSLQSISDLAYRYLPDGIFINTAGVVVKIIGDGGELFHSLDIGRSIYDFIRISNLKSFIEDGIQLYCDGNTTQTLEKFVQLPDAGVSSNNYRIVMEPIFVEDETLSQVYLTAFPSDLINPDYTQDRDTKRDGIDLLKFHNEILENVTNFLLRWRKEDGIVTFANERYARMHKETRSAIIGSHIDNIIPAEDRVEFYEKISKLRANEEIELTVKRYTAHNDLQWRFGKILAIGNEHGEVISYQSTGIDFTDRILNSEFYSSLIKANSVIGKPTDEILDEFLRIGTKYLQMPVGFISKICDDSAFVEHIYQSSPSRIHIGMEVSISEFEKNQNKDAPVSLTIARDLAESKSPWANWYKECGFRTFIGAVIVIQREIYGTLCFVDTQARTDKCTQRQEYAILQLANWIGHLVERQRNLASIRQQYEEFQFIYDQVPALIMQTDSQHRIVNLNQAAIHWLGYPSDEIIGRTIFDVFPLINSDAGGQQLRNLEFGKTIHGTTKAFQKIGNATDRVTLNKIPYHNSETNELRFLVMISDVSESHLKPGNLESWQTHFHDHYAQLPLPIYAIERSGKIVEANDTGLAQFGFDRTFLIGQKLDNILTPDSAKKFQTEVLSGFVDGQSRNNISLNIVPSDKIPVNIELSMTFPTFNQANQPVGLCIFYEDSNHSEASSALVARNHELEITNERLEKFAWVASHDLQEPLRKIQQFTQFVAADHKSGRTEDDDYHIRVIQGSVLRMRALIQDILDFSSARNDELLMTDVDLAEILKDSIDAISVSIEETGAQIDIDNLPTVTGNPVMLDQLFRNLISNSIKYCSNNLAPKISISVRECKAEDKIILDIADNGIGFDESSKNQIFEPFSRLHRKEHYPGTGLGLAICQMVCDRHGWCISAHSENGTGSCFSIAMPTHSAKIHSGDNI